MKLLLPIIAGCLLSCCLNVLINNIQYGKNVVKLDKDLEDYENDEYIPNSHVSDVNMLQSLKWNIIPSIINLMIWGGIIWFITRQPVANQDQDY